MKSKFKVIALCLAMATLLLTFASCSSSNSGTDQSKGASTGTNESASVIDKIKQKGELVMLTNATFPPFEYQKGTQIAGVDVEIANEIAKELGVKLKVQHMEFDLIVDYIKAGKGDIGAAGMTVTEERKKQVDFSTEYVTSTQYVIVPATTDTKNFKLDGRVIGCQLGTTGDVFYASDKEVINAKEVKRYDSAITAAEDLKLGRLDCVIIDELPAKKIAEKSDGKLIAYDAGYDKESYAIAISKSNPELKEVINKVLEKLISEKKVDEFVVKHSS